MSAQEPAPQGVPTEEELRAAYEAELARITATDMIAQAAVSLLNIGARRIGPPPAPPGAEEPASEPGDRDLEQVRDAIDAAMALLAILDRRLRAEQLAPLRDALSRLQMAYAAEVGSAGSPAAGGEGGSGGGSGPAGPGSPPGGDEGAPGQGQRPGPAESSGRLWVPGQ